MKLLLLLLIIVPIILCGGPPGCNLHKRHAERPCNEYAYQTGQSRTAFAGWKCVNVNGKGVCRGPHAVHFKKKKIDGNAKPPGCKLHKRHADTPCNMWAYEHGKSHTPFAGWKCVNVKGKGVCQGPHAVHFKKKKIDGNAKPPGCNLHKRHADTPCNMWAYEHGKSHTPFAGWHCRNVKGKGVCKPPGQLEEENVDLMSYDDSGYSTTDLVFGFVFAAACGGVMASYYVNKKSYD